MMTYTNDKNKGRKSLDQRALKNLIHDLRSPLTALKLLSNQMQALPMEQRQVYIRAVERIEIVTEKWNR